MQGRAFLKPARTLANERNEADWRGAAVHAYYALFLECREALVRWGWPPTGRHNIHHAVRLRFIYATDAELKQIGTTLEELANLRSQASYDLGIVVHFTSPSAARIAIQDSTDAIAQLDAIEADPNRRAAAIASLPP
jgi:HEPN domain-containing protein